MINYSVDKVEISISCCSQETLLNFIEEAVKGNPSKSCLHFSVEAVNDLEAKVPWNKVTFTIYNKQHEELINHLANKYSKEYN